MEPIDLAHYEIALDADLYPLECITNAIQQYQEWCRITVTSSDGTRSFLCIDLVENDSLHPDMIVDEFLNYLLDLCCRLFLSTNDGEGQ